MLAPVRLMVGCLAPRDLGSARGVRGLGRVHLGLRPQLPPGMGSVGPGERGQAAARRWWRAWWP